MFITCLKCVTFGDDTNGTKTIRIGSTSHMEDFLVGQVVSRIHDSPRQGQYNPRHEKQLYSHNNGTFVSDVSLNQAADDFLVLNRLKLRGICPSAR